MNVPRLQKVQRIYEILDAPAESMLVSNYIRTIYHHLLAHHNRDLMSLLAVLSETIYKLCPLRMFFQQPSYSAILQTFDLHIPTRPYDPELHTWPVQTERPAIANIVLSIGGGDGPGASLLKS
jgi:hypothetical protein